VAGVSENGRWTRTTFTMKGMWAMKKQTRVAVETENGRWTISNVNREQGNKGKERVGEKSRCGGDISEHKMDDDCLASKKVRCFLHPVQSDQ
jgi:hypothetical protein